MAAQVKNADVKKLNDLVAVKPEDEDDEKENEEEEDQNEGGDPNKPNDAKKKKKKKEGPSWFEKTFNKLSNEIFSDDDMK